MSGPRKPWKSGRSGSVVYIFVAYVVLITVGVLVLKSSSAGD
jgi:hypothetical protein